MSGFVLTRGVEGYCLSLDGTRIAGPKPWGGGRVVATFATRETYVHERTCRNDLKDSDRRNMWPIPHFKCSSCGGFFASYDFDYCPSCGARVVSGVVA